MAARILTPREREAHIAYHHGVLATSTNVRRRERAMRALARLARETIGAEAATAAPDPAARSSRASRAGRPAARRRT